MDLEDLFAQARAQRPRPSDDLIARILADSAAARPAPTPTHPPARTGRWAALLSALGGWPALGALAASVALGFGLGVASPTGLPDLSSALRGDPVSVALGIDEDPLSLLDG